jgi:hypothetical protein
MKNMTISVEDKHWDMIKRANLKPSHVLREALNNLEINESGQVISNLKIANQKISRLLDQIYKMGDFMKEKGLQDEFLAKA